MSRVKKFVAVLLLVFIISCSEKEQTPFIFVQLCDTQLGFGGYEHDVKSFKTAVQQINKLNPDFVVICGDLVNHPTDSSFADFKEIVAGLKMPCYPAPGNHDVRRVPNDTSLYFYREIIGKDYYKFQNKGYSFIVTNTQLWKVNVENESEKHDQWFQKTLKENNANKNPTFVIGHYPLYAESLEEEESYYNLPLEKRKELISLLVPELGLKPCTFSAEL